MSIFWKIVIVLDGLATGYAIEPVVVERERAQPNFRFEDLH